MTPQMCEILLRPLRWKVPSTHLLLFLPEKNRSGRLVRTALREDLENLSSCTRKLAVPVLAWGRTGVFGQHRVRLAGRCQRADRVEHFQIHLPFALDGDTHRVHAERPGRDVFPTAQDCRERVTCLLGNSCEPERASASRRGIFGFS